MRQRIQMTVELHWIVITPIRKGSLCMYECTHRGPSKWSVVTVFLPGAVQTDYEILEKGMSSVEHWEPDDVDPLVRYIVQLK